MRSPQDKIKNIYMEQDPFNDIFRDSLIELLGDRRILIENHKGISSYDPCRIDLCVSYGVIEVWGQNLTISYISQDRVVIHGKICQLTLNRGET